MRTRTISPRRPPTATTRWSSHHFAELAQQHEAGTLGMWVFLGTEIMFIGAIFVSYFCYRLRPEFFEAFKEGSNHLYTSIGFINTLVLLTSSLTVVLAIRAAQDEQPAGDPDQPDRDRRPGRDVLRFKILEYYLDWKEHLWPSVGGNFQHPRAWMTRPRSSTPSCSSGSTTR